MAKCLNNWLYNKLPFAHGIFQCAVHFYCIQGSIFKAFFVRAAFVGTISSHFNFIAFFVLFSYIILYNDCFSQLYCLIFLFIVIFCIFSNVQQCNFIIKCELNFFWLSTIFELVSINIFRFTKKIVIGSVAICL